MADRPDLKAEGFRTSGEFAVNFQLNEVFVETVGAEKAEAFRQILVESAANPDRDTEVIAADLEERANAIGVRVSDQELTGFADQIKRSAGPVEQVPAQMVEDPNRTVS